MNRNLITWEYTPNETFQSPEDMDFFLQHPTYKHHYNEVIGSNPALCIHPSEDSDIDSVWLEDVPEMKLIESGLTANNFYIGDLYVGTVDGRRCIGTMHDFTGMYILTSSKGDNE